MILIEQEQATSVYGCYVSRRVRITDPVEQLLVLIGRSSTMWKLLRFVTLYTMNQEEESCLDFLNVKMTKVERI